MWNLNWKLALVAAADICFAFRDKTVLVWHLTRGEGKEYGAPRRSLKGHSHFVQDVVISSDGQFALSGSWDGTLRLWDLNTGTTTRRFIGHTKDVLSVAFSVDNRQVRISEAQMPIRLLVPGACICVCHEELLCALDMAFVGLQSLSRHAHLKSHDPTAALSIWHMGKD